MIVQFGLAMAHWAKVGWACITHAVARKSPCIGMYFSSHTLTLATAQTVKTNSRKFILLSLIAFCGAALPIQCKLRA
ncbi:MAG: hypothetical protein JO216_20900 [Hyphomicrobiales bacterium]|nr:hypothetical protein [Hyphomicrobiales bacterium]MBW0005936.1 hypothetical protein [Hyphomicrobiales bacterium]